MSNVIVTLLTVALLLNAVAMLMGSTVESTDLLADGWNEMEATSREIARTKIDVLSTSKSGTTVNVTIKNTGQIPLLDFKSWDLIVRYQNNAGTHYQKWLTYDATSPPASDKWTVTGIYKVATSEAEIYQPNILDPSEEMVIRMELSPAPNTTDAHLSTIGTPNGVSVSAIF